MINQHNFIEPTPIGTYFAINSKEDSELHKLLRYLLKLPETPYLDNKLLQECRAITGIEDIKTVIKEALKRRLVTLTKHDTVIWETSLEIALPELFREMTDKGKILLADEQGLCLGQIGFDVKASEQLAALSADIAIIQERHELALKEINEFGNIWGMIDPIEKHQVSFWPIFIGNHRFVLVLAQKTVLNQPVFTRLIRILSMRYA